MESLEQRRLLGDFVRARRAATNPDTALSGGRKRRTPGLRREELAARAGIGVTWVSWIEQGREVRPSAETLGRLAAALHLGSAERAYLFELAGRADPANPFVGGGDTPGALAAISSALPWPAYGLDPVWNVVCANRLARRLFAPLFTGPHPNLLRFVFTAVEARALIPDWEARAIRVLAEFRADFGRNLGDPRIGAAVAWLNHNSPLFRVTWEKQAVAEREGGLRRFIHPEDGPCLFRQHTLRAHERADFKLVALEPVADAEIVDPGGGVGMRAVVGPAGFEPAT